MLNLLPSVIIYEETWTVERSTEYLIDILLIRPDEQETASLLGAVVRLMNC